MWGARGEKAWRILLSTINFFKTTLENPFISLDILEVMRSELVFAISVIEISFWISLGVTDGAGIWIVCSGIVRNK